MVQVETYLDPTRLADVQEETILLKELKMREMLARECGMGVAARTLHRCTQEKMCEIELLPLGVRKLTKEEKLCWHVLLPVAHTLGYDSWHNYASEMIPLPVLEIIKVLQQKNFFSGLTIRTPKKSRTHAALIGEIDETWYLLARWTESDEPLIPIEEVPHAMHIELKRRFMIVCALTAVSITGAAAMGIDAFTAGLEDVHSRYYLITWFSLSLIALSLLLVYGILRLRTFSQMKKRRLVALRSGRPVTPQSLTRSTRKHFSSPR